MNQWAKSFHGRCLRNVSYIGFVATHPSTTLVPGAVAARGPAPIGAIRALREHGPDTRCMAHEFHRAAEIAGPGLRLTQKTLESVFNESQEPADE